MKNNIIGLIFGLILVGGTGFGVFTYAENAKWEQDKQTILKATIAKEQALAKAPPVKYTMNNGSIVTIKYTSYGAIADGKYKIKYIGDIEYQYSYVSIYVNKYYRYEIGYDDDGDSYLERINKLTNESLKSW